MKQRLADNISLVAQTPDLDCAAVDIVVTIPTFKRPEHVLETLRSVSNQKTQHNVAIIVMENEAEAREGANACSPLFEAGTHDGLVIIAHDRGNCCAYNAGWFTALTKFPNLKYIAVIDDDEIAAPQWLENLCATAEKHDASFVGGPQLPVFEGAVNEKWKSHQVFKPHYETTGMVDILYSSGNLLVRRDALKAMPQPFFDLAFNFTGGGDADLMRRAKDKGFDFAWCTEAEIHETVPERRVTWGWIQKRALRNGQLSALIAHRRAKSTWGHLKVILHSLALLAVSPVRSLFQLVRSGSVLSSLYPVHIALGRIASEFGYANEQYRNPEQN
ncbi:glycosyltransferase [Ahrensia kielensis]|uniref:Glycosyltransferase n=1 Tax=Ahrensia kielensis TaxID=76980 RepID=A0ABU9T1Q4_9HYPH